MGTGPETYAAELDRRLEAHLQEYRQQINGIFSAADAELVSYGREIDPTHNWAPLDHADGGPKDQASVIPASPEETAEISQEEANARAVERVIRGWELPRGIATAQYMVAAGTTYEPYGPDIARLAHDYRDFDEVVRTSAGQPLLHVMHCSTEVGIIPEDAKLDFVNSNRYPDHTHPYIYGIVRGANGWDAGHFAGGQGETHIRSEHDFRFFPETNVMTGPEAAERTQDLLETGTWYGVHTGIVAAGNEAVNATLASYVRHELAKYEPSIEGNNPPKRTVGFIATRSLLAISLLREQGYDWLEHAATDFPAEVDLVGKACLEVTSQVCTGGITTRGDFWNIGDITTRLAAYSFTPEDREHIVSRTTELFKESEHEVAGRLASAANMSGGSIEAFIEGYVDNFLRNILGSEPA
jgi:hypothetical protein